MIKLFHNDMSVCAQKVRLVLAHKRLPWQGQHLNLRAGDQFKPEFLKLNPKAVIPVLQHDSAVITESTTIVEYIDEVFPELPLMPSNAAAKAKVRYWMIKLDAGLHEHIAIISFCLAFRFQMLERYPTDEALAAFLDAIPDRSREAVMRDVLMNGVESQRFELALYAYDKVLAEMDSALVTSDYLVNNAISLADYSLLPYIERLAQLGLDQMWSQRPNVAGWYNHMKATDAYRVGMQEWHNDNYIALMGQKADDLMPVVSKIISTL